MHFTPGHSISTVNRPGAEESRGIQLSSYVAECVTSCLSSSLITHQFLVFSIRSSSTKRNTNLLHFVHSPAAAAAAATAPAASATAAAATAARRALFSRLATVDHTVAQRSLVRYMTLIDSILYTVDACLFPHAVQPNDPLGSQHCRPTGLHVRRATDFGRRPPRPRQTNESRVLLTNARILMCVNFVIVLY